MRELRVALRDVIAEGIAAAAEFARVKVSLRLLPDAGAHLVVVERLPLPATGSCLRLGRRRGRAAALAGAAEKLLYLFLDAAIIALRQRPRGRLRDLAHSRRHHSDERNDDKQQDHNDQGKIPCDYAVLEVQAGYLGMADPPESVPISTDATLLGGQRLMYADGLGGPSYNYIYWLGRLLLLRSRPAH